MGVRARRCGCLRACLTFTYASVCVCCVFVYMGALKRTSSRDRDAAAARAFAHCGGEMTKLLLGCRFSVFTHSISFIYYTKYACILACVGVCVSVCLRERPFRM